MKITDKECRRYVRQIKSQLICKRKERKDFLNSFSDNIEEFLDANPDAELEKMQEIMGTPQEIADSFLENVSPKSIKTRLLIKKIVIILVIIALLAFGIYLFLELLDSHRENLGYGEIILTEETTNEKGEPVTVVVTQYTEPIYKNIK